MKLQRGTDSKKSQKEKKKVESEISNLRYFRDLP